MGCMQVKDTRQESGGGTEKDGAWLSMTSFNENLFRTVNYKRLTATYTLTPLILGAGNFGKVFLAYHNINSDFKVAVKTMKKAKIGDNLKKLKQEIKILSQLDHPNICKYYETYESPKHVYLIMEYCGWVDLF